MKFTNKELLNALAFKQIITVDDLGKAILQPEKFAAFVRAMQHKTVILDEARFIKMDAQIVDIDRVGFVGRILRSGTKWNPDTSKWEHRKLTDEEHTKPQFATNQLIAKELQAITGLRDKALRRNIERGNFETTLVDLFGEAAGRDMEEFAILANTDISYTDDDILSLTDGWIKLAANKVYGWNAGKDFDPSAATFPENMFQAMIDALPKQFLQNESEWRIYVDWDVRDDYIDLLRERQTDLGDRVYVAAAGLVPPYKGIAIKYVPMFNRSKTKAEGGVGRVALLSHPANMAWGVFHEVTVEPDRIPSDRRTDFVLTLEGDAHYEDENGAVAALIDQKKPVS